MTITRRSGCAGHDSHANGSDYISLRLMLISGIYHCFQVIINVNSIKCLLISRIFPAHSAFYNQRYRIDDRKRKPTTMASTESNISVKDSGTQSPCAKSIRAMYCVDVSDNPRIPILMELVGSVSRANTPQEIYHRFRRGMHQLASHSGYISVSTRGLKPGEYKITRMEVDLTGQPATNDPWNEWDKMTTHAGGFFGELIRGAWP